MNPLSTYKTVSVNKMTADKQWFVVDANGQTLGRMASQIASVLRGKNKPSYTPHVDCGDNVIVINAEHVVMTAGSSTRKSICVTQGFLVDSEAPWRRT